MHALSFLWNLFLLDSLGLQAKSPATHVPHSTPDQWGHQILTIPLWICPLLMVPNFLWAFSYQFASFHSVLSTASEAMLTMLLLKIHPFSRALSVQFKSSLPTVPLWSGCHLLSGFTASSSFTQMLSSSCSDALWLFNMHALSCHSFVICWDLSLECLLTISFLFLVNLALPNPSQFHVTPALITLYPHSLCAY